MFKKILIANRGEIAVRIIRTCRELGVQTVAVYSEADRGSLHVRYADEAYCIGPAPAVESYLDAEAILAVARSTHAEAIHPGYGFLSENAAFAKKCVEHDVVFIGPDSTVIENMGNKTVARQIMIHHGIPIIPGATDATEECADALKVAHDIGFPVMLKAASGGGGKGMRIVHSAEELTDAFLAVRREAYASFADSRIFVEKYFSTPRHIEVQVMADNHGNAVHLYERECSIQRRYQKVVEECPSVFVDDALRKRLTKTALHITTVVGYSGAGTVEFLVDQDKNHYFLEMNTRIQVEHSVTELVTGVDMVKEQLLVASGSPLSINQDQIKAVGAAIECRIYAEDPEADFLPAPGPLKKITFPEGPGVRIDSGVYSGWQVSRHYDPMIAKIATWGRDRNEARIRMLRALDECVIYGVKTNVKLHKQILADQSFIDGNYSTKFIAERIDSLPQDDLFSHHLAIIGALCARLKTAETGQHSMDENMLQQHDSWRMSGKYQFWASRF